jgi:hypothetical protein
VASIFRCKQVPSRVQVEASEVPAWAAGDTCFGWDGRSCWLRNRPSAAQLRPQPLALVLQKALSDHSTDSGSVGDYATAVMVVLRVFVCLFQRTAPNNIAVT